MFIGLIVGFVIWFFSKSILFGVIGFYFATGIRKSSLWLGIPIDTRHRYLPPMIQNLSIGSFIKGVFFWPLIVGFRGDPIKDFFKDVDNGSASL